LFETLQVVTPQEESHRMTTIRKVYQKAILVPTSHVEQLWKDYDNFESSVSRTLVIVFTCGSLGRFYKKPAYNFNHLTGK
jgi:hypothetical protein